jgi:hypothetical protein
MFLIAKLIRITVGIVLSLAGVVLLPLPGPGLLVIALGVGLLARDIPIVRRAVQRFRALPWVRRITTRLETEWHRFRERRKAGR